MKFKISFDENIYNKQMDLLFDIAWQRKKDYYKNSQYLGIVLIVIGILLILKRPNIFGIGYMFLFFGLSNFMPFVYYSFKIKKEYKKLNTAKIEEIEILKQYQDVSLELNDEAWIITAEGNSKRVNWDEFVTWVVKEENLIIITKDYMPYILGMAEVGSVHFEEITSFVKTKVNVKI